MTELPIEISVIIELLVCIHTKRKRDGTHMPWVYLTRSGFLPGIFFLSGRIYCYANFFCYAIVFGPNFRGGQTASGGDGPPVEESQRSV